MRTTRWLVPLLLALLAGAACEDGAPWTDSDAPAVTEAPRDFGPVSAYDRHLFFLGPGQALPTAAVFDFASLSDSSAVRGGVRSRLLEQGTWTALLDEGWTLDPMREPWRIIPHGPLKLVVTDAGEVGTLALEGDPAVRLVTGPVIAEASPDVGTHLVLRQAALGIDADEIRGILLDAQLGRSVSPDRVPGQDDADDAAADTSRSSDTSDTAAAPGASPDPAAAAADSLARLEAPTPIARPGTEAFLVDDSGYSAVLTRSNDGRIAWISNAGRDEIRRGVYLEATAWAEPGDRSSSPTRWAVRSPDGEVSGQLATEAADHALLPDLDRVTGLDYVMVSGWLEDRGARRSVFGLVRHVR